MKFTALALLTAASIGGAQQVSSEVDQLSTTQHQMQVGAGRTLRYTAYVGRIPIRDAESDEVHAFMSFVAYRVPSGGRQRPVTFLWNGGPGSNSSTLHLLSVGPKRLANDGRIVDNLETALPTTDLVFVDAVGTGFGRPTRREYAKEFYQTRGDVASFVEFIRAWRLLFDATDAPLYVGGESWGGYRTVAAAMDLTKRGVPVSGAIVISGRTGLPEGSSETTFHALRLVHLPEIARHHGKLAPELARLDRETVERQVRDWVLGTYVPALQRIDALSSGEREAIAARLALYTGLPLDQIDRRTLIVPARQHLRGLLGAGKTLATNNMMVAVGAEGPGAGSVVDQYLRGDLGVRTSRTYIGRASDGFAPNNVPPRTVGSQWDYTIGFHQHPVSPDSQRALDAAAIGRGEPPGGQDIPVTTDLLNRNPQLRLLLTFGRWDSLISCAGTEERLSHVDSALRGRIIFRCYPGGHMFYREPETRRLFSDDLQAFTRSAPRQGMNPGGN